MSETVRCKFKCTTVTTREDGSGLLYDAEFLPVSSGSEENKEFWKWTPAGRLNVGTVKRMPFEVGKEYYLDITPAE